MKRTPNYKLLAIDENNKYVSATGNIVLYLNAGVKLELANGGTLETGRLFLRAAKKSTATARSLDPAAAR